MPLQSALPLSGFFEEIIQALILHIPLTPLARSAALCALPDVLVRPPSGLAGGGLAPVNINEIRQAGGRGSQFIHIKKRRQADGRPVSLSLAMPRLTISVWMAHMRSLLSYVRPLGNCSCPNTEGCLISLQ